MKIRWMLMLGLVMALLLATAAADEVKFRTFVCDSEAEEIDLGRVTVGSSQWGDFYNFLDQLPRLKRVTMWNTNTYRANIDHLTERWPQVQFDCTLCFAEHKVRTDATAFSTLHSTSSKTHSAKDISIVTYCKNLKALDFGHNGVDDLSFLYQLPELRVLICGINRVTDITPIASLEHLEYLEMFTNSVTDISPLTRLTHLMDLNISYNLIEDLTPLTQMPWLKRLWMYRSTNRYSSAALPEETQAWLRKALPNTEINFINNPTAGGWRDDHPHYLVIREMFRNGDFYIRFEDSDLEGGE